MSHFALSSNESIKLLWLKYYSIIIKIRVDILKEKKKTVDLQVVNATVKWFHAGQLVRVKWVHNNYCSDEYE